MFALADCNNFFASCEVVFNPKLVKKALVILSNNDGCIIARSPKAKALGVKMGDPAYLHKDNPEVVMLSSNFPLYSDMSQRVMQTLSALSPEMEIYSIDEAFFHLENSPSLIEQAVATRNKVKQWTGIPVSIGIAPTKTLAKLSAEIAKKKAGVHLIEKGNIEEILQNTPLNDIWGIGKALTQKLKTKGIYTALELTKRDDAWLRKLLGVTGLKVVLELRGIPCFAITQEPEKKKSIVCSRSFSHKIDSLKLLEEAIATFTSNAAAKLRAQGSLARFISVFIATKEKMRASHIQLENASACTSELITRAKEGLFQIFEEDLYYKGGILLGDFTEDEQGDLLKAPNKNTKAAMLVLDQINARFHKKALYFAAQGVENSWKSKQDKKSPKFTTSWSDLIKVL